MPFFVSRRYYISSFWTTTPVKRLLAPSCSSRKDINRKTHCSDIRATGYTCLGDKKIEKEKNKKWISSDEMCS